MEGLIDPLLKEVNFPILSANIKAKGPLASKISGLYSPYKILTVGDEVVGIVGYTSKETPFLSNPGIFFFYSTHCLKIGGTKSVWHYFSGWLVKVGTVCGVGHLWMSLKYQFSGFQLP